MDSLDNARVILGETEWGALLRRLTSYALSLAHEMPNVFDGISPDDLVGETLVAYLVSESGLNWDPTLGSLEAYLGGVLKKKFLVHARRSQHCGGSLDNDQFAIELPAANNGQVADTIADRIRAAARGDKSLEELITASQGLDGAAKVNQQLSELLNTTVEDVVNRKKRLTRRVERAARAARSCVHLWSKSPLARQVHET